MNTTAPFVAPPPAKPRVRLAAPGAGSALGVINGAMRELVKVFHFVGFAGTSGGGLDALAYAAGLSPDDVREFLDRFLQRHDLLDMGAPWDAPTEAHHTGIYRGRVIESLLKEIFGETTKMGDLIFPARVGVASLWTKKVAVVDSVRHPDVLVWRAARATMGIEAFFDSIRLRPDNARTYADGGAGLNVPAGIWDDKPEPTLIIRFAGQQPVHTVEALMTAADGDADYQIAAAVRTGSEVVAASFNLLMDAASAAFPSKKTGNYEVVLSSPFDGLKFGLSAEECTLRDAAGAAGAVEAMKHFQLG